MAPDAPEAEGVLDELLGPDADRAAVLERLEAGFHVQANRYRELIALVNGRDPKPPHADEFAWVVAALRARVGG